MNRYPDKIKVTLSPGVQTVGEVTEDTIPIVNDGFKDYDVIYAIDRLFLIDTCQVLVEPNTSNSAITLKVKRTELEKFVSMLNSVRLTGQYAVSQIKSLIENRIGVAKEKDWVSFQRKDVSALAILRSQLEKTLLNINISAVMSRIVFLPVSNQEFVSRGDQVNFQNIIDLLNSNGTKDGTRLIRDALKYTPGEIGCNTLGTLVKSADISLESKSVVKQIMQNQSRDLIYERAINAIDAYSAPEMAVLPLNSNAYILKLTEVRYEIEMKTTFNDDIKNLDMAYSYLEQDWYTATRGTANASTDKTIDPKNVNLAASGFENILTQIWLANVDTSLGDDYTGAYLVQEGYNYMKPTLQAIFPPVTLSDGKTVVDLFANLAILLQYGPFFAVRKWTSDTIIGQAQGSMTRYYQLFLKSCYLNLFPNLCRLGRYVMTRETVSTEVLRTVLGNYAEEYSDYVQKLVTKKNLPATVVIQAQ